MICLFQLIEQAGKSGFNYDVNAEEGNVELARRDDLKTVLLCSVCMAFLLSFGMEAEF